ncbi:MAG TPA: YihY/virulence factor BrkB family protein [Pyrinomonadaceae bacterium]|nr:YihY/virulence factor BrkB family protein [Pyrinomonadaceae bacterium]
MAKEKASMWGLGDLSYAELAKRTWAEFNEDDVLGRAAQLSYYFLLALFPLLLFLTAVLGLIAGEDSELRNELYTYLSAVLPRSAVEMVSTSVNEAVTQSGGGKLSFGVLATLWAASNGMGAITESLNIAYDVEETRPWWKKRLLAVFLTVGLAVLVISALVLVLMGGTIAEWLAAHLGLGAFFEWAWKILQWPIVLAFVLLAFGLVYYFAPDLRDQKWHWVTPGAIVGVALWLLVSFAFRIYLSFFDSYSATYGSLGAVIVLMLWFYFTGIAILVGGEINSEVEHAMAEAGDPEAKEKGEKFPDQKETTGKDAPARDSRKSDKAETPASAAGASRGGNARASSGARTSSKSDARLLAEGTRGRGAHAGSDKSLSVGKVALALGAWAVSKVRRNRPPG